MFYQEQFKNSICQFVDMICSIIVPYLIFSIFFLQLLCNLLLYYMPSSFIYFFVSRVEIDTKLPILGEQKWKIWICSFNIPMAPGKTRSIVCSARNFFQFTMPGPAWWQVR